MTRPDAGAAMAALAGEHPGRRIGRTVLVAAATESTNDDARRLIAALGPRAADGYAIATSDQRRGRGTRGRAWWTPPGRSLALSVIVVPERALERPAVLTVAAAVSVVRAAADSGAALAVRWPNDVVDARGRKVAGVLAESVGGDPAAHVIGIGVNVLRPGTPPPAEVAQPIASIEEAGGGSAGCAVFADRLLDHLDQSFAEVERAGTAPAVAAFNAVSWLSGRSVELRRGERTARGVFRGMSADLEVLLEGERGALLRWPGEQVELLGGGAGTDNPGTAAAPPGRS